MFRLKNLSDVERGLELFLRRAQDSYVAEYRNLVWAIFYRLVTETPQFTGLAAASWNIGVGAPDRTPSQFVSDVKFGDPNSDRRILSGEDDMEPQNVHKVGDRPAVEWALRRNAKKIPLIKGGTKVYFTNTALGDASRTAVDRQFAKAREGKSRIFYLEALQNPDYWQAKLREENKPYETADETVLIMQEKFHRLGGNKGSRFAGNVRWEAWV